MADNCARQVKRGTGWQLGWNPTASEFKGLVGGEHWSLELTEAELNDFCRLVVQLAETMAHMASELVDEEKISCEAESDRLWLEVEGYPHAYSLRMIVLTGRRAEGFWPEAAVTELIHAAQTFRLF